MKKIISLLTLSLLCSLSYAENEQFKRAQTNLQEIPGDVSSSTCKELSESDIASNLDNFTEEDFKKIEELNQSLNECFIAENIIEIMKDFQNKLQEVANNNRDATELAKQAYGTQTYDEQGEPAGTRLIIPLYFVIE